MQTTLRRGRQFVGSNIHKLSFSLMGKYKHVPCTFTAVSNSCLPIIALQTILLQHLGVINKPAAAVVDPLVAPWQDPESRDG